MTLAGCGRSWSLIKLKMPDRQSSACRNTTPETPARSRKLWGCRLDGCPRRLLPTHSSIDRRSSPSVPIPVDPVFLGKYLLPVPSLVAAAGHAVLFMRQFVSSEFFLEVINSFS